MGIAFLLPRLSHKQNEHCVVSVGKSDALRFYLLVFANNGNGGLSEKECKVTNVAALRECGGNSLANYLEIGARYYLCSKIV